jgi:hypothetical protein
MPNARAPLSKRQIRRSWVCAQTLRRAAHDNRDSRAISFAQNSLTRTLRDGAHTQEQEDLAVKWNRKVRSEGQEMRTHAREAEREAGRVIAKIAHRTPLQT